ncbi:MAG: hypothetical protein ACLQLC_07280 [Candidatus Sulfotelmatobacter sp.]
MNNLAYNSRDPQTVAPKVEELIRKELGAAVPIAYTVAEGTPEPYTVGSALRTALVGGQLQFVFQLNFELPPPRPARLQVSMCELGTGCLAGTTLYSSRLSKFVGGEIALEPPNGFLREAALKAHPNNPYLLSWFTRSNAKFVGDPEASRKLNANRDLLKLANKFARTESLSGGRTLKRDRLLRIVPDGQGCALIVGSLPRTTSVGFSATLDSKDFFELATLVERSL